MLNYYKRYNLVDWAKDRYSNYVKYPTCSNCKLCEKKCPYDLPIRDMLKETYELLSD